jgi:hypothetical protein
LGCAVSGFGCRVQGCAFRVLGLGSQVFGSGVQVPDLKIRKTHHPPALHSYEGTFGPFGATHLPSPYPLDPPYIPTVSPTAGAVDCSIAGYPMNPVAVRWATTHLERCAVLLCSFVTHFSLPGSKIKWEFPGLLPSLRALGGRPWRRPPDRIPTAGHLTEKEKMKTWGGVSYCCALFGCAFRWQVPKENGSSPDGDLGRGA